MAWWGDRRLWGLGTVILAALVLFGIWLASWPTPFFTAWQLRNLNPAVIATTTACLESHGVHHACRRLQARLVKRANDLRPADIKPIQAIAPIADHFRLTTPAWPLWHLAHWPAQWSKLMMQCYDLGEIEDRAPPTVEARYQACNSLVQLAGRQRSGSG